MQAEPDVLRRAAIFSFPQQFEGLKGLLGGFLEQVFEGGAELHERAFVRGVYFTSGTQEGSPIDRVLGTLGRTFGVEQRPASVPSWRGKAFFLTRLLKEVVFAEQGLVGRNHQAEARRRRWRTAALAIMMLASVGLVAAWALGYARNRSYLEDVRARIPEVQAAVAAGRRDRRSSDSAHRARQGCRAADPHPPSAARSPVADAGLYRALTSPPALISTQAARARVMPRVAHQLESACAPPTTTTSSLRTRR
jgi:type VI secretion system protein ImpL